MLLIPSSPQRWLFLVRFSVYARLEPLNEKEKEKKTRFRFQFQGFNLALRKRKRLGMATSEPDTVIEIARKHDSPTIQSWVTVFRSNPVYGSFSPCWDVAEIELDSCCRDEDLVSSHGLIHVAAVTLWHSLITCFSSL